VISNAAGELNLKSTCGAGVLALVYGGGRGAVSTYQVAGGAAAGCSIFPMT
jgi:hypothetical protein